MTKPQIFKSQNHFRYNTPQTQAEWETTVHQMLQEGQAFLAYDFALTGLNQFPGSLKLKQDLAQALIRVGALEEARQILESMQPGALPDSNRLLQLYHETRKAFSQISGAQQDQAPSKERLEAFALSLGGVLSQMDHWQKTPINEETAGLLGRVYKDLWKRSGDVALARRSRDIYLRAYHATQGYYTGINAAAMSWLIGEREFSGQLARRILDSYAGTPPTNSPADAYWALATQGEAHLLLADFSDAQAAYQQAIKLAGNRCALRVSSYQQLRLLSSHGLPVPEALFTLLAPPVIVSFVGHMIDQPNRAVPRFPVKLEAQVRQQIDEQLDALNAQIGYCSAACGADLLFIEAMQERDAEVNIVLPFDQEDFIKTSVAFAGERWVHRFHRALKLANSVKYVTEEKYLGDDLLFGFAGSIFQSYATLRAQALDTTPHLIAVWDGNPKRVVGGTADIIAQWTDAEKLHIISLPAKAWAAGAGSLSSAADAAEKKGQRAIHTMLSASIVGDDHLQEELFPFIVYEFLARISHSLKQLEHQPRFIHTWGDQLFVVMDDTKSLLAYALALQKVARETQWASLGLPEGMKVRIALHAGPVFEVQDPFTDGPLYYGVNVNHMGQLTPAALPGHIYASEQFVAMLYAETKGEASSRAVKCSYVGAMPLSDTFGQQVVYHLHA